MYKRLLQKTIENNLFKGKVIILLGARQVGKTTLVKELLNNRDDARYINCELLQNKELLETTNSERLKFFLGNYNLIALDEAQSINNIGLILKIIHEELPKIQILATGSSSFDLKNVTSEPLTGRSRQYTLYPLALQEIGSKNEKIDIFAQLENILRYGLYPAVYGASEQEAIEELSNIASNYLFKDVLMFEKMKHPDVLLNLLKAIALQLGSEVSYNELSRMLGVGVHTVKRYIELLEKSFIVFSLSSYSTNPRKEIAKGKKIYFYDLGIRNFLIQNFNPLSYRTDVGALWENFCIVERRKINSYKRNFLNVYFWRTYAKNEIDFIEEYGGKLHAYEFKYSTKGRVKPPKRFLESYPDSDYKVITPENFFEFIW